MICKKCGAKNSDVRKRCFNCGNILVESVKNIPEKQDEKYNDYPDDTKEFQSDTFYPEQLNYKKNANQTEEIKENLFPENEDDSTISDIQNIVVEPVINSKITNESSNTDSLPLNLVSDDKNTDSVVFEETDNVDVNSNPYSEPTNNPYDNELSEEDYEILKEIQADKRLQEKQNRQHQAENIRTLELDETIEQHFKAVSPKQNTGIGLIIWILVLLFIIVALFMGMLIYNYINTDNDQSVVPTIDTTLDLGIEPPEVVKLLDKNGTEYLHAVFTGIAGDRIYLECNNSYHTFVNNKLEIDLYLEDLFNSEYEFREESVEANMHAYYVRGTKKYSCQSPYVKMSVPLAELDLTSLSTQNIKVYNDIYNLKFWTSSTAKVELNGENISSSMNGTGSFNYEIKVPENSNTTYYLTVSQPYRLSRTEVFILSRDSLPVTLTIAYNNEESQSDKTITLRCQTEENTTLKSNLPIISQEWNELYSTADITLDLSSCDYGEIEALITATNSKGSSTKSHIFLYWPDEKTITTKSDKFTSAIATNCTSYTNKNYVLNSVKAIRNTSANRIEGSINLDGIDYELVFDISDISSNIIIGNNYKIFAKCTGTYENDKPLFRAWFIYKG